MSANLNNAFSFDISALKAALKSSVDKKAVMIARRNWVDVEVSDLQKRNTVSCAAGCSHCCKGSRILISKTEAEILTAVTGRKHARGFTPMPKDRKGEACSFLDSHTNQCIVYMDRPIACRTAVSFDDPQKCATEEKRQMLVVSSLRDKLAGQLNVQESMNLNKALGLEADIREFFPQP